MGRRANPVPANTGPRLRALATALRRMKESSGLTYAELAKRSARRGEPKGAATLSQAAAGHRLPRLDTALAFARAAADPDDVPTQHRATQHVHTLWTRASVEHAAPLAAGGPPPAAQDGASRPKRTLANLALGLRRMRAQAGQPSLKALEGLSEAAGYRVPKSTVHLILAGRVLPTRDQLAALLTAVDSAAGSGRSVVRSRRKWMALRDFVESRASPAPLVRVTGYGCVDGSLDALLERRDRDEGILRKVGKFAEDEADEQDEYRLGVTSKPASWDVMDDEELAAWEQKALEADLAHRSGRDLLAELRPSADS
ncbi:hypothetical protein [Kitasatospora sp. NPDC059827]|uniref:hypothetical protein n=1 Tax=Kitasatospora sp. NPDC059827 TaxID=3346964 RepID=UPI003654CBB7